ncbi:MAG: peptidoglycan-binding protein [bacterium]|nr:peptidoglycan-binding protein [bacterium]
MRKHTVLLIAVIAILGFASQAEAFQVGETVSFIIDAEYDISSRQELQAQLAKISEHLAIYVEKSWWDQQTLFRQQQLLGSLNILSLEFESKTYPLLTSAYGSEWKPGVDGDEHVTALLHEMKTGVNGYFRTGDEYLKLQLPESNEREMVYLSLGSVEGPYGKSLLAHEFTHLITFNQKEKKFGVSEETWLNEMRAEYAPTFLGYNIPYEGSYLQARVQDFLKSPSDSLTEWRGQESDYGVATLFTHYLVDQYGMGVLIDSLHSEKIGIASLDEALLKNGFTEDFATMFSDWTLAVTLNDCSYGKRYCYLTKSLEGLRLYPTTNFLPLAGESMLSLSNVTKSWSGNWYRFIGGQGSLTLEFSSLKGLNFKVPYLIQNSDRTLSLQSLSLSASQTGKIMVPEFGTQHTALILVPSLQSRLSGFNGIEPAFTYSIKVSIKEEVPKNTEELMATLLSQIAQLQAEVARLRTQLKDPSSVSRTCSISESISMGSKGPQVQCLQEILKKEGSGIYPEGLVTGYFGSLTRQAVVRFQEKYSSEILFPLGLSQGTGFVGFSTRSKLNQFAGY